MKIKTNLLTISILFILNTNCSSNSNDNNNQVVLECNMSNDMSINQDFTISSIEDVMLFLENPNKEINGTIYVSNLDDLSFLNCLEKVYYLSIGGCTVQNLKGLTNLKDVTHLRILNMPNLTNFIGVDNLKQIKFLEVINNPQLINFSGLDSLDRLGGIKIEDNEKLESFNGLNNVTTNIFYQGTSSWPQGGNWRISNNSTLTSISALNNVSGDLNSILNIYQCNSLNDLGVFEHITVANSIFINSCPRLNTINCFPNLIDVNWIGVYESNQIESIIFPSLEKASYIRFSNNDSLNMLNFNSLTQISTGGNGDFSMQVEDNISLKTLNGFNNLEYNENIIDININDPSMENPIENICALRKLFLNKIVNNITDYKIHFRTKCAGFLGGNYADISQFDNICDCN